MIIGFHGKIGSGKDTAAKIALGHLVSAETLRFAHGVKEVTALLAGTTINEQHTPEGKASKALDTEFTNGDLQQIVGTDLGRMICDDIWVKKLARRVEESTYNHVIIPDVRFVNEAQWILEQGGIVIKIEGDPMEIRWDKKWLYKYLDGSKLMKWYIDVFKSKGARSLRHASETSLDDFTFYHVIRNDRDLGALKCDVLNILTNYIEP